MLKNKAALPLLLLTAALLTGCGTASAGRNGQLQSLKDPQQTKHETVAVAAGTFSEASRGSALVHYPITEDLAWDGETAYVQEIHIKKGQKVKKGDVLAVFSIAVSSAQKKELELQLQRKEESFAAGKNARRDEIAEAKAALEAAHVSQKNLAALALEKLEISYEQYVYQTERELASLRQQLNTMLETQNNNTLVAPFDGVIKASSSYRVGDKVNTGDVLASMYSEEVFYLRVSNAEGKLRYGMEVTIETGRTNNKKTYTGIVVAAPNVLDTSLKMEDAYIQVSEDITPDDFESTIQFVADAKYLENVLLADSDALYREEGKVYVYVLEEGVSKKRYVTSATTSNDIVWILDGLREGQLLIVE